MLWRLSHFKNLHDKCLVYSFSCSPCSATSMNNLCFRVVIMGFDVDLDANASHRFILATYNNLWTFISSVWLFACEYSWITFIDFLDDAIAKFNFCYENYNLCSIFLRELLPSCLPSSIKVSSVGLVLGGFLSIHFAYAMFSKKMRKIFSNTLVKAFPINLSTIFSERMLGNGDWRMWSAWMSFEAKRFMFHYSIFIGECVGRGGKKALGR